MVRTLSLPLVLLALLPLACATAVPEDAGAPEDPGAPDHAALLAQARSDWSARRDEASAIWVGRRLAYLGRYEESVAWYGERLADFPDSYRLLRHRGHRWITLRAFERAQADLERAWELAQPHPDAVEPDGLPNARGIATGTDHTNILYHLALAQYLQGAFAPARRNWELCHRAAVLGANGADMQVAAAYWQHLARARADERAQGPDGAPEGPGDLARGIAPDLDIVENHAYHRLCLLLTGRLDPAALDEESGDELQDASLLYGLARWHAEQGRPAEARALLERILRDTPPAAFAHIAAEADVRALQGAEGAGGAAALLDPDRKETIQLPSGMIVHYRAAGDPDGEPVLLLHGFTDTSRSFLPLMLHLARLRPDLRLLAPDLRGHGETSMPAAAPCRPKPQRCFRVQDFSADAIELLAALGIERAHVVGHSLGSAIAQEMALEHPDRVRHLVLLGSAARFGGVPGVEFLRAGLVEGTWKEALVRQKRRWPEEAYQLLPEDADPQAREWLRASWVVEPFAAPAFLEDVLAETLGIRLGTWIGVARTLRTHDNVERLRELTTPTLVLWATQDSMFPESPDQETLRAALDAAPLRGFFKVYGEIPLPSSGLQESDLGHNFHWGAAREVALDLASFLREGGEPTSDLYRGSRDGEWQVETVPGGARVIRLGRE